MRVIHLLKHCEHGHGMVHVAVDLACVQAQMGYDVVFASAGGKYEGLLQDMGVALLKVTQNEKRPLTFLNAIAAIMKANRERRFDVIHAHMMSGAVIGFGVSFLTGVPLVTTVHNSFNRHSLLMRLGHRVVAVSTAEKDLLVRQGYRPERVDVVLNGPNESPRETFLLNPNTTDLDIKQPCVTTICGLHRRKGVSDLISAFGEASRNLPEWRLYIVGEGPDRSELENLVRTSGLHDRIFFLGSVPVPRPILENSDIFVLASYADPCSLAVAEARGAGCAIVATSVGGTPELLEFGRAGRLVQPGNPTQLAAELRGLMVSRNDRSHLRSASKQGGEFFNVRRMTRDYEPVYQRAQIRA
jgi:glycosyltransferase involved in cell wall biosynthesis